MTLSKVKSSVVLEPYESMFNRNIKASKDKPSTCTRSESSSKKWKVSESITPVTSDSERFPLRISYEKIPYNRSLDGSSNETFEKNVEINFYDYASSSSLSQSQKFQKPAVPLFSQRLIKENINHEIVEVKETQQQNPTNNELIMFEVDSHQINIDEAREDVDIDEVVIPSSSDEEGREDELKENDSIDEEFANELRMMGPPIMQSSLRNSLKLKDKSETSIEMSNRKVNVEPITEEEEEDEALEKEEKEVVVNKTTKIKDIAKKSIENDKQTIDKLSPPTDLVIPSRRRKREAKQKAMVNISQQFEDLDDTKKNEKSCKSNSLENCAKLKTKPLKMYSPPVDLDSLESCTKLKTKPLKMYSPPVDLDAAIPLSINNDNNNEPLQTKCRNSNSSGIQTKLCDTSKSYILSQESSMISSPLDHRNSIKSTKNLPGRNNVTKDQILSSNSIPPMPPMGLPSSQSPIVDKGVKENKLNEKCFFKSSFNQRRNQEIQRFHEIIEGRKEKSKSMEKPKTLLPRKRKEVIKKPRKKSNKSNNKYEKPIILSPDSCKAQLDRIPIEDSENDKYNQPIETTRCADPKDSDEDLFSFTPDQNKRRKVSCAPKKTNKTKKSINGRKRVSNEIYDVVSDLSSPLPPRLSYRDFTKSNHSPQLNGITNNHKKTLTDSIVLCEHYLEKIKFFYDSISKELKLIKQIH